MGEYDRNNINDTQFESLLRDTIPELPPEDIVRGVTPWRKAISRTLTGFALCAVTLNFWGLDYLLPAIGMILTLLGFRMLRKENKWFSVCWCITVIRCTYYFPILILNATIYRSILQSSVISFVLNGMNIFLQFALYFCLWKALHAVQRKAGLGPQAGGAAALMVWSAVICLLVMIQAQGGLILGIILLIAYICIIRSLVKLSRELDEAGYCIAAAPLRITDRSLAATLVTVILAGCCCGYLFFNHYPMDWKLVSQSENGELRRIKDHLIALGFPEHILEDLTEEDIRACENAIRVVVDVNDHPVNKGRRVQEVTDKGIFIDRVFDQKELRITGIGVELAGEREQWKLIQHFHWLIDPGFYGTEAIQLWPAYRDSKGWLSHSGVTGQVLYNKGSQVYAAPYYSLGSETYTLQSVLFGEQTSTDVFATFSMPGNGENHRGYVSYTVAEAQDGWIIDAWINYTHQAGWFRYPFMTAKEKHMTYGAGDTYTFLTVQDALQFFPNRELPAPIEGDSEK